LLIFSAFPRRGSGSNNSAITVDNKKISAAETQRIGVRSANSFTKPVRGVI
jgi:hypothetical protein